MKREHLLPQNWAHAHFPGGGMWILSATVVADALHHIIDRSASPLIGPTAFSDYYDTFSGVSGGSIALTGILTPDRFGSRTPRHRTFTTVREHLMADSGKIFDPSKQKGFFFKKTFRSAIGHAADSLKMHFDHARDHVPGKQMARRLERVETAVFNMFHALGNRAMEKSHFNSDFLYACLDDRLKITYPQNRTRPARMLDLIKPAMIPSIRLSKEDNSYLAYLNPVENDIHLQHVPDRFKGLYTVHETAATAAFFSSLQSPLFPAATHDRNGAQTDGGALFTARSAVDRFRHTRPELGWKDLYLNVFECNMSDKPSMVVPSDLERTFIPQSIASNLQSQKNARRHDDYIALMTDPRTRTMVEFSRAARPGCPPPLAGRIRTEMEFFASQYCHRTYLGAMTAFIPPFSPLSQAATSTETHGQFVDAGIQTVVRMLPELILSAKELVSQGPLSQKLTPEQQHAVLFDIDSRFPSHEIACLRHLQSISGKQPVSSPAHNDFVYFTGAPKKQPAQVEPVRAVVQDYGMAK